MRITRCALTAAILGSFFLAGCGESDESPKNIDLTPKAPADAGKGMLGDQMKGVNLKEKSGKSAVK